MPLKNIARLWLAVFGILTLTGVAAVYSQLKPTAYSLVVYQDPT